MSTTNAVESRASQEECCEQNSTTLHILEDSVSTGNSNPGNGEGNCEQSSETLECSPAASSEFDNIQKFGYAMVGKPGKESEMKILIGRIKFFSENKLFGYIAVNKKAQGKDPTDYWFHGGNLCDPIAMFPCIYFRRRYVGDAMDIDKNLRMENFSNLAGREVAFTGVEGNRGFKASSWMFKERYEEEYQKLLASPKYRLLRHISSFRSSAVTSKVLWQGRDTASLSIEFPVENYWDDVEDRMVQAIQISPLVRGDGSTIRHSFEMEDPETGEWIICDDPRVELSKVIA